MQTTIYKNRVEVDFEGQTTTVTIEPLRVIEKPKLYRLDKGNIVLGSVVVSKSKLDTVELFGVGSNPNLAVYVFYSTEELSEVDIISKVQFYKRVVERAKIEKLRAKILDVERETQAVIDLLERRKNG